MSAGHQGLGFTALHDQSRLLLLRAKHLVSCGAPALLKQHIWSRMMWQQERSAMG